METKSYALIFSRFYQFLFYKPTETETAPNFEFSFPVLWVLRLAEGVEMV